MKLLLYTILNILAFQFLSFGQDTVRYVQDSTKSSRNLQTQNSKPSRIISYGAPVLLLSYGFLSFENKHVQRLDKYISHDLLEANTNFSTDLDDHFRYLPVLLVYSLNAFGIKGKSNFIDRSALYLISNLLLSKSVDFLKDKTHRLRPSQADFRAFPSGHTALAFGAAEFMRLEYKDASPWYGYAAYSVAVATGTLKIIENVHWLSDVLAGAGVGILSTKVSYLVYPWLKEKVVRKKNLEFRSSPFIGRGFVGFSVVVNIK